MIRVPSPIPEPSLFDAQCRTRGNAWIANHPNPRPKRPLDYWSDFREDLRQGFSGRCGYLAMYFPDGAVDHFIPWDSCKSDRPELAYEWSNFRFISPSLNSMKGAHPLLDPFLVKDDWFEVDLPSLVLKISNRVPQPLRELAKNTVDRLELQQGRRAVILRWEWYDLYRQRDLSFNGLMSYAPLIGKAVARWESNKAPLPAIPRPS